MITPPTRCSSIVDNNASCFSGRSNVVPKITVYPSWSSASWTPTSSSEKNRVVKLGDDQPDRRRTLRAQIGRHAVIDVAELFHRLKHFFPRFFRNIRTPADDKRGGRPRHAGVFGDLFERHARTVFYLAPFESPALPSLSPTKSIKGGRKQCQCKARAAAKKKLETKNPAASHKARSREGGKPQPFARSYDLVFSQPLNVFLGHAKHRLQNLFCMLA